MIMATHGVVTAGHYLAAEAGMQMLRRGGNAMDAAAAVGFALAVLKPHQNGIAGEVPILGFDAAGGQPFAVSGNGVAPRAATIDYFREQKIELIPGDGFLPAIVPPAVDTWVLLLSRFGTMRLRDVLSPAIEYADSGFAMYDSLRAALAGCNEVFANEWPSSAAKFLPDGQPPALGAIWRQPQWAATFKTLIDSEAGEHDRESGLRAARDRFYKGDVAETIVRFARSTPCKDATGRTHTALLSLDDFAAYHAKIEQPVAARYRGIDVLKCSSWTQGPVLLQMLALLEGFDLSAMGHNSAEYIHTVTEAMKLAFADREFYYGDPDFVEVPFDRLLSRGYAAERRVLIDAQRASMELRPGGSPGLQPRSVLEVNARFAEGRGPANGDTTKLEVIDAAGNVVSATQSGGWLMTSPVVPGLGFPLGTRGQMFSLQPGHPNALVPGKRPRTTLTPSLAMRDGKPWLAFGSPGGDMQDQWALQAFLNVVEFGMSLQEAVEAPTFWTLHAPSSFYPRSAELGVLCLEGRISGRAREQLATRGHLVRPAGAWAGGNTLAASVERDGVLCAAASPRLDPAYAVGF